MRVLVVAYYFPPTGGGGVNRTLKVVRGIASAGWKPIVLTVDRAAWVEDPALLDEVPPTARVIRLPNPDWGRVSNAGRPGTGVCGPRTGRLRRILVPDLHVGWSALAASAAAAFAATRAVDVVYTTCPPYSASAAGIVARALGVPWVCDFRDGWSDCPTRSDLPVWRQRLEWAMESAVLRRADRILFAGDGARARRTARWPELEARCQTVLTGFDPRDFAAAAAVHPPADRLEVVHAGSVVTNHLAETLDRFLGALRGWSQREPRVRDTLRVRLVGAESAVAERVSRAGVADFVAIEKPVARGDLASRLRRAHACLAFAADLPLGEDPIPGKLFDAVGADRPLLALTPDGALARVVRGRRLGIVVDPRDEAGIVRVLGEWRRMVLAGKPIAGPPPESRESLTSRRTITRILGAVEEAAGSGGRAVSCASR